MEASPTPPPQKTKDQQQIEDLLRIHAGMVALAGKIDRLNEERVELHARAQRAELERDAARRHAAELEQALTAQTVGMVLKTALRGRA